ncbi:MAG TPA: hypothetical protein VH987_07570 [Candidatus Limnocylindria bacterium]|jgi:hypothetical protein
MTDQVWTVTRHRLSLRGTEWSVRLARFPRGWLASVDTVEGPTLGSDASPYLALSRAFEPLGMGLDVRLASADIVAAARRVPGAMLA